MSGNSKLLLGFAAGLAAGLGLYAFLKSEKGQQTLSQLKRKANDLKEDMEALTEKGKQMAEDLKQKFTTTN
jgi:uncharacterized protein HemX